MMVIVTVLELLKAKPTFGKLQMQANNGMFNFILSYKLYRLFKNLSTVYTDIFEQQECIFNKFGIVGETRNKHDIPDKNKKEFDKVWEILLNKKITFHNVTKFKLKELSNFKSVTLKDVENLQLFMKPKLSDLKENEILDKE